MGAKRVAVVGAGWGGKLHLKGFGRAGAELVGLYSRSRTYAEQVAARYGVPVVAGSMAELLDVARPDVVSIASPPPAHHEQTLEAVAAGRHVLCDKPVALTGEQATEMVNAARAAGVHHAVGFIWRGDPALRLMRDMLRDGAVGQIREIHTTCFMGSPLMPANWMYDRSAGGGSLMQHGSHVIDRVRWLLDAEITAVSGRLCLDLTEAPVGPRFHDMTDAMAWAREHHGKPLDGLPTRPVTADVGYEFAAELSTGARARFWESWHAPGPLEDQVTVIGDEATLVWAGAEGLRRHRVGAPVEVIATPGSTGSGAATPREAGLRLWAALAGQFLAAIEEDTATPDHPTLVDGCQVARVSDAVWRSHTNRRWETT